MVFTISGETRPSSIVVSNADGSGQRAIVDFSERRRVCCAQWTPDSRYIVFEDRSHDQVDIWAAQIQAGFLQRVQPPVQLTNGPLSYAGAKPSTDGKQIFAVGTKRRGELVRYDVNSKQFVPILAGISAFNPTFSSDGKWVAYTSYPDQTLWRSRADGTDRLQLTDPPVKVHFSCVSPDGTQVAYGTSMGEVRVMSMDGGSPRRIAEKNSWHPSWSPDGTRIVFGDYGDRFHTKFLIYDLRTGNLAFVPETDDVTGVQWVGEELLVGASNDRTKLVVFDLKTQKWSDLVLLTKPGTAVNWAHAPDFKYVYYTTGGVEPQVLRVRLADHKVEALTSLKDLSRHVWKRPDPDKRCPRRLRGLHPRHRHPGNLRAQREVAVTFSRDPAARKLPLIGVVNRPSRTLSREKPCDRITYDMGISQHMSKVRMRGTFSNRQQLVRFSPFRH